MPLASDPPGMSDLSPGDGLPGDSEGPAPLLGITRSTRGGDLGVGPGMVNTPASSGVTRMMVDVDEIVTPLMISIRRDWPTRENSSPGTTGRGTDKAPVPEVMIVSCADSPREICGGSIVASTETAADDTAAMPSFVWAVDSAASKGNIAASP